MYNLLKKIKPYLGIIPAIIVAVCICVSLSEYVPVAVKKFANMSSKVEAGSDEGEGSTDKACNTSGEALPDSSETPETSAVAVAAVSENTDSVTDLTLTSQEFEDGIYYGTGKGFCGEIKVRVEIKDGKITQITIVFASDDSQFLDRAKTIIPKMISAQTPAVDGVSGATYSSRGIKQAVVNALKGAVKSGTIDDVITNITTDIINDSEQNSDSVDMYVSQRPASDEKTENEKIEKLSDAIYKDGTYEGSGNGFAGEIKVRVDINNGKIANIEILQSSDGKTFMELAKSILNKVTDSQNVKVDTVSGATYSSRGIIGAIADALNKAVIDSANAPKTDIDNNATKEPVKSAIPSAAPQPTASGNSQITASPDKSDSPVTSKPAKSNEPATAEPAKSDAPATAEPAKSDKPVTPKPAKSNEPATPTPTATPFIEEGKFPYKDGTYYGSGRGFSGDSTVAIEIKNKKIIKALLIEAADDEAFISRAVVILDRIVAEQNTDVDVVSGATYSSKGILSAVQNALDNAEK